MLAPRRWARSAASVNTHKLSASPAVAWRRSEVDGDVGTGAVAAGVGATVVVGARGRRTSVPQATTVKLHTIDTIARKPAGDERIITAY
jgi:hypothetical protein